MQEKNKRMGTYEGMYIINSALSEESRKQAFDKIKDGITQLGGKIIVPHEWGRRKLEYKIKREGKEGYHSEGYYYILFFEAPTLSILTLWGDYKHHEDLVRFMTMRVEKVQDTLEFKPLKEVV
jgi:small subunit ribosomal protein S6